MHTLPCPDVDMSDAKCHLMQAHAGDAHDSDMPLAPSMAAAAHIIAPTVDDHRKQGKKDSDCWDKVRALLQRQKAATPAVVQDIDPTTTLTEWQEPLRTVRDCHWIESFHANMADPRNLCNVADALADDSLGLREHLRDRIDVCKKELAVFRRPRHPNPPPFPELPGWAYNLGVEARGNHLRFTNLFRFDTDDVVFTTAHQPGHSNRLYQIVHVPMFLGRLMERMVGAIPRPERPDGPRFPWHEFPELAHAFNRTVRMMAQVVLDDRYSYSLMAAYTMAAATLLTQINVEWEWVAFEEHAPVKYCTLTYEHILHNFDDAGLDVHGVLWRQRLRRDIGQAQLLGLNRDVRRACESLRQAELWVLRLFGYDVVFDVCDPVHSYLAHHTQCRHQHDWCTQSTCGECETLRLACSQLLHFFRQLKPTQLRQELRFTAPSIKASASTQHKGEHKTHQERRNSAATGIEFRDPLGFEIGRVWCEFLDRKPFKAGVFPVQVQQAWVDLIYFSVCPTSVLAEQMLRSINTHLRKHAIATTTSTSVDEPA